MHTGRDAVGPTISLSLLPDAALARSSPVRAAPRPLVDDGLGAVQDVRRARVETEARRPARAARVERRAAARVAQGRRRRRRRRRPRRRGLRRRGAPVAPPRGARVPRLLRARAVPARDRDGRGARRRARLAHAAAPRAPDDRLLGARRARDVGGRRADARGRRAPDAPPALLRRRRRREPRAGRVERARALARLTSEAPSSHPSS